MAEMPNAAGPQKPPRRWFQFRLRTLLLAVLLAGIVLSVGREIQTVRTRRALLASDWCLGGKRIGNWREGISIIRQWFGDERYDMILIKQSTPRQIADEFRAEFPEADIRLMDQWATPPSGPLWIRPRN